MVRVYLSHGYYSPDFLVILTIYVTDFCGAVQVVHHAAHIVNPSWGEGIHHQQHSIPLFFRIMFHQKHIGHCHETVTVKIWCSLRKTKYAAIVDKHNTLCYDNHVIDCLCVLR